MAVRADDDFARRDNALFRQQRVLDAHAAHFVVVDDVLRAREFAHLLGQRRGLDILVRHKVIRNQRDLRGIKDLCCAHPIELVDGHGGGDVVAQHKVQLAHEQFARAAAVNARSTRKDFLCHGHAHSFNSSLKKKWYYFSSKPVCIAVEGFQRANEKPLGRTRRYEIL